jgi:glycosyltransferase involved in cell wall biosynthesis
LYVSFVIPAYNEENSLSRVIQSVHRHAEALPSYEVIVVDHGSTDRTVETARALGADVYVHEHGTISALRNYGANRAAGEILVFLDADVLLTKAWEENIADAMTQLRADGNVLTGSWYGIRPNASWVERFWFEPLADREVTHMNGGHLILAKDWFWRLDGFPEHLETGEDYELSMKAQRAGMRIVNNPALLVIHEGYPRTLSGFLRREVWHGRGDAASLGAVARSKVALTSLGFVALHLTLLLSALVWRSALALTLSAATIVLVCTAAAFVRYRGASVLGLAVAGYLYYWYFWARASALVSVLLRPGSQKRSKSQRS